MSSLNTTPISEEKIEEFKKALADTHVTAIEADPPEVRAVEIIVDAMDDIEARINMCNSTDNDYIKNLAAGVKLLAEAYVMVKEANR